MAEDDQFSYPLTTFDQDTDYLMDTVEEISVGEYEEENTNLCPTSGADIQKIYGCNDISYAVSDCGSELCYCGSQPITHDTQPLGEYENEPARSYSPSQEEIDVSVAMLNDDKYIKQQELLVASKALLEQVLTNLKDIDDDLKSWENVC